MTSAHAAILAMRQAQQVLSRDSVQDQIDFYNKQPLPEDIPEHILKCTERKKLVIQTPYFKVPPWASMPSYGEVHLEVVKEGITIGHWPLYKWAYVLIGKNPQVCEYVMEHPTTSGVHCALVFHGEKREYYLIDLSTNGTTLNGTRVVKGQPTSVPFESTIVVGHSTRTLILKKSGLTAVQAKRQEGKNNNLTVPNPIPTASSPQPASAATSVAVPVVSSPQSAGDDTGPAPTTAPQQPAAAASTAAVPAPAQEIVIKRHFRHLLLKHVEVADPVSKAPRNKGEAVTRSLSDAVELAQSLRSVLMANGASCDEAMFVQFCQDYSECKSSKKGGDLGVIAKGDMDSNFDGPAFRLAPGAVSGAVTTDLGVHLIFRCPE